ncbi:MAG: hypothetical protein KJ645_04460 [Planctomycetes bacterium]|nr:hypothetical protein [Planctomycetota bacterium]
MNATMKGFHTHMENFNRAAKRVVRRKINADLPRGLHQMALAKYGVKADANTVETAQEMTESLIDILA